MRKKGDRADGEKGTKGSERSREDENRKATFTAFLSPPETTFIRVTKRQSSEGFFHKKSLKSLTVLDNHVLDRSGLTWPLKKEMQRRQF